MTVRHSPAQSSANRLLRRIRTAKSLLGKVLVLLPLAVNLSAQAQPPRVRLEATDAYVIGQPGVNASSPALDLAKAILERAGLAYSVEIAPWARAYALASSDPDVLLITLGRTPERESHFHWIAPTYPLEYRAYRLKERADVVVNTPEDLRRYRISVVRDSAIVPYLRGLKLAENRIDNGLQFIPTALDHWNKLLYGRVDLFVGTSLSVDTLCHRGNFDCNRIATAWIFPESRITAWIALSGTTDPEIVQQLSDAYAGLKAAGGVDRLLNPAPTGDRR